MTQDKDAYDTYRKLSYFYENSIKVHFKDIYGIWYNGLIIDLSKDKWTIVLKERVKGDIPVLLEDIKKDSIVKMKEVSK